ncbi:MAG TPA: carboxyl transferase domain-containing protein [Acidimicrobiales bacterium]|jgi:acetyl-CoA carboxylase carboxyl transferase subunit beta|nr:carboxyl transferase domain-containing protein [Acidimicrobiales bacterium]
MELPPLVEEWDRDLRSGDPLGFPGYAAVLDEMAEESVRTGRTQHVVVIEGRFEVLGGSMGVVAGEKVCRAYDRAVDARLPVVVVTRSGGARMQEGMVSLIQMGRTAAAARRHARAGLLSVALHRSPTTGGVFASYGSLCDVRAVEAEATIGFAGPRVVAQTTGTEVGGRSHTSATAYAAGLVDAVVAPHDAWAWVEAALGHGDAPLVLGPRGVAPTDVEPPAAGAWGEVQRARGASRPTGIEVAAELCRSWTDLHSTDPVTRAGLASIGDRRVVVIAHDRKAGDGRSRPDGFRLAQRAIDLAGRLALPLVTLIDTPGADPSSDAELHGVAGEIARTFAALAELPTASVAVCVGEGGSGGALALGHTDRLLIQEHAVFSVIGPEGAAAILERDAGKAAAVAPKLRLTSGDLLELGIVDAVVPDTTAAVIDAVSRALDEAQPGDRARRTDAASALALSDRVVP